MVDLLEEKFSEHSPLLSVTSASSTAWGSQTSTMFLKSEQTGSAPILVDVLDILGAGEKKEESPGWWPSGLYLKGQEKNNKLTFCGPKWPIWDFWVHFCVLSQEMRNMNFF